MAPLLSRAYENGDGKMRDRKEIEENLTNIASGAGDSPRQQAFHTANKLQIELLLDIRELLIDQGITFEKGFVPKWGAKLTNPPLESFKK